MSTRVNEHGRRVGESHPKATLSNYEVEQMINDRGSDVRPAMSYSQLAKKYGVSKTTVHDILTGLTRGQAAYLVAERPAPRKPVVKKVQIRLTVSAGVRARIHRLGGAKWIERILTRV